MKQIIKQGYVKPQYITECNNCHTLFSFTDDDTEYANASYSTEQYVRCPYCGYEVLDRHWEKANEAEGGMQNE